ncbi:uncharacterized protein LOC108696753 isoform X2 [Xenopus laevis]|uniref:Uncharacterized protein LOC108696753 isoform X2 n=1 Tax=Xenopus laevis TaxID=8355 RepID=A0A8J1L7P0_XENLA|nr:uncharacterized protein LOC108696753 isoform X2 [Xenopus laevis]
MPSSLTLAPQKDKLGITELAKEFGQIIKSIEATISKGGRLMEVINTKFQELKLKAEIIFATFEEERACPNLKDGFNCGVVEQKVTQCGTCTERNMVCVGGSNESTCDEMVAKCPMCVCHGESCHHKRTGKPCHPCKDYEKCLNEVLHCKDQEIQILEGEYLVFDCSLKFLESVDEEIEYVLEKRNESGVVHEKTSRLSHLLIPKADNESSGHYVCTARSKESTFPISRVEFNVTVSPPPPPEDNITINKWIKITVIIGSVISFVIIASIYTCIGLLTLKRKRNLDIRAEKKLMKQKNISMYTQKSKQTELGEVKITMDIEECKPKELEEVKITIDIEESKPTVKK